MSLFRLKWRNLSNEKMKKENSESHFLFLITLTVENERRSFQYFLFTFSLPKSKQKSRTIKGLLLFTYPQLTKSYFGTATQQRNKILGLAAHPDLIIRFIRFRSRFTTSDPFRTTLSCRRLIIVRGIETKDGLWDLLYYVAF